MIAVVMKLYKFHCRICTNAFHFVVLGKVLDRVELGVGKVD